jgi:putative transposase
MPLLTSNPWRAMLSTAIDRATARHGYRLAAFVYMPEHVHLLVYPLPDCSPIFELLRAIKRPYSFRIKKLLEEARSPLLQKLTIRQRPGVTTFRYWQEGPGYDRNLTHVGAVLAAIDYIHRNPVRRGLCQQAEQWRWSSARYFADSSHIDADLPMLYPLPAEFLTTRT